MNFNELLLSKNMSQKRLSEISGVPRTNIVDICKGRSNILNCNVLTIYKIAKALSVTVEDLINCDNPLRIDNRDHLPEDKSYLECGLPKNINSLINKIKLARIKENTLSEDFYKTSLIQEISSCYRNEEITYNQKEYLLVKYC